MAIAVETITYLSETEVVAQMSGVVEQVRTLLPHLPRATLKILLHSYSWDPQQLLDDFWTDEEKTYRRANCVDPGSILPSEAASDSCDICCDSMAEEETRSLSQCQHRFHTSCWQAYLSSRLLEDRESLRLECAMTGCQSPLDEDFLASLGPSSTPLLASFWSLLAQLFTSAQPSLTRCPGPDCTSFVSSLRQEPVAVHCRLCGHSFCFCCSLPPHYSVPCRLVRAWGEKRLQMAAKSWVLEVLTQNCPSCSVTIQRVAGCNIIKCKMCDTEFCWICLGKTYDHHCRTCGTTFQPDKMVPHKEQGEELRITLFQRKFNMLKNNMGYLSLNPKMAIYKGDLHHHGLLPLEKIYQYSSVRNEFETSESISVGKGGVRFRILFTNVLKSLWTDVDDHKELSSLNRGPFKEAAKVLRQSQEGLLYGQVILYLFLSYVITNSDSLDLCLLHWMSGHGV